MRLIGMLILAAVALLVWYIRTTRREVRYQREGAAVRASRKATLEVAAATVEQQAELSRDVARRIEAAPVEIPSALRVSLFAVIGELDGVAADLRACQVPLVVERRTLIHR